MGLFRKGDRSDITEQEIRDEYPNVCFPRPLLSSHVEPYGFTAQVDTVEKIREKLIREIKSERDRRKLNGVFVAGKWIHTDVFSRTQWSTMWALKELCPVVEWTSMDGTKISTGQALAAQVVQAVMVLDSTLFNYASALIEQINMSNDPTSIDIYSGWLATYEG